MSRGNLSHPWRELRAAAHIVIHWVELHGRLGLSNGRDTIWMDPRQYQRERRSTLAHELEHLRRGHDGCVTGPEERRVSHAAARRLLPDPRPIADAVIANDGHLGPAADDLFVDTRTLAARLDPAHVHPAEKAYFRGRFAEAQVAVGVGVGGQAGG